MNISATNRAFTNSSGIINETHSRLDWVDYARGLAIILVVYRHTMVGLTRSGLKVPDFLFSIQEFLLNVRMPVFFVLSGIFLARSYEKRSAFRIFIIKCKKLLYPYLIWAIILVSIQIFLSDYTNSTRDYRDYLYIFTQPRELDHMWYLLALFNTTCLLLILYKFIEKYPFLHIVLAVSLHFYFIDYSIISDLMYNYIFLVIGVYSYRQIPKLEKLKISALVLYFLLLLPVFVAGQLFWLNHIDKFYRPYENWYLIPFLLIILIACIVYYFLSRIIYESGKATWLKWIGRYSLYIYILHLLVISSVRIFFVQGLKVESVGILILASLLLGLTVPVLLYKLSERAGLYYLFSLEKPR